MHHRAFTLIELLIVVAIIAILAAIAVPNFLEAQTRAKVSRVKADFRTVATALESYRVDYNRYPELRTFGYMFSNLERPGTCITSPVAYITAVPKKDVFRTENRPQFNPEGLYQYFHYLSSSFPPTSWIDIVGYRPRDAYSLVSWGPDRAQSEGEHLEFKPPYRTGSGRPPVLYDPTNGTVSFGDIVRFGGASESPYGLTP